MKKLILLALTTVLLAGCTPCSWYSPMDYEYNREVREQQFTKCMELLPEGPETTTFNDWNEVVISCKRFADSMARFDVCDLNDPLNYLAPTNE